MDTESNGFAPDSALVFTVLWHGRKIGYAFRYYGETHTYFSHANRGGLVFRYTETVGEQRDRFHRSAS